MCFQTNQHDTDRFFQEHLAAKTKSITVIKQLKIDSVGDICGTTDNYNHRIWYVLNGDVRLPHTYNKQQPTIYLYHRIPRQSVSSKKYRNSLYVSIQLYHPMISVIRCSKHVEKIEAFSTFIQLNDFKKAIKSSLQNHIQHSKIYGSHTDISRYELALNKLNNGKDNYKKQSVRPNDMMYQAMDDLARYFRFQTA